MKDIHSPQQTSLPCVLNAWEQHEAELRRYLLHHLPDVHLADDLVQDVFLKAIRQGKGFCALENRRAWLFQVARNALIDTLRLTKPTVPLPDDLAPEDTELAPVDALAECLPRVLAALAPDDSEILRHCDLEGMKQQAYADAHGISLAATKSRLLRARQRMREWMVKNCDVGFDARGAVCCHAPASDA